MTSLHHRSPLAAAALIAVLGLGACGDDDGASEPAATTLAEPSATTSAPGNSTTTTAAPGTTIEIEVSGGAVVGGADRHEVALGDDVTVSVVADVDDEVHLHGYDVLTDLVAGEPAQLSFTADIPGVFELELEGSGLLLARIEVR